jgi:ribosomal protein S18 acetylase RimI-like enzyme
LKKRGYKQVLLYVADYNQRAINFYKKFGFSIKSLALGEIQKTFKLKEGLEIIETRMVLDNLQEYRAMI